MELVKLVFRKLCMSSKWSSFYLFPYSISSNVRIWFSIKSKHEWYRLVSDIALSALHPSKGKKRERKKITQRACNTRYQDAEALAFMHFNIYGFGMLPRCFNVFWMFFSKDFANVEYFISLILHLFLTSDTCHPYQLFARYFKVNFTQFWSTLVHIVFMRTGL